MNVSSCRSHTTSRYDHRGDTFAIPPRYPSGTNDNAFPTFRENTPSLPGYVSRPDGLGNLPPIVAQARPTRPSSYHDPHSARYRVTPRSNTDEPPLSLVPMDNLIAHHPFPRDVQDEQVLRVFMPRLE